jgi:predicted nuclease of predicted toxin-antitoxin system
MKIYLDDNRAGRALVNLLVKAGHTVVRPVDVGLAGKSDACHLEHAVHEGLVLLTADRVDYWDLHQLILTSGGDHPGILVVRYQNDPARDMKAKHIAAAVTKLEQSGMACANQIVVLNQWR